VTNIINDQIFALCKAEGLWPITSHGSLETEIDVWRPIKTPAGFSPGGTEREQTFAGLENLERFVRNKASRRFPYPILD